MEKYKPKLKERVKELENELKLLQEQTFQQFDDSELDHLQHELDDLQFDDTSPPGSLTHSESSLVAPSSPSHSLLSLSNSSISDSFNLSPPHSPDSSSSGLFLFFHSFSSFYKVIFYFVIIIYLRFAKFLLFFFKI